MRIDQRTEHVFPVSHIPRHAPPSPNGKPLHPSTGFRWAKYGLLRPSDRTTVILETFRRGHALYTSAEALQRFFDRLGGAADQGESGIPGSSRRRREIGRSEGVLDAAGIA